jgi:O-antigen/teichoic acid export membrane protein
MSSSAVEPVPGNHPVPRTNAAGTGPLLRRFAGDSLRYLPSVAVPSVCALVGAAIFTRMFKTHDYGIYVLLLSVAGPVVDISMQWVAQPVLRFHAEYEQTGRSREFNQVVITLILGVVVLVGAVGGIAVAIFAAATGVLPTIVLVATLAFVLSKIVFGITMPLLRATMQPGAFSLATAICSTLSVAIPVVLIELFGVNIAWLLWGQAVATMLVIPFILWRTRLLSHGVRLVGAHRALGESDMIRRFARFGVPMMAWFVAASILSVEDRFVIAAFRNVSEVAIYNANYNLLFGLGAMLTTAVTLAVGPLLYREWAQGDVSASQRSIAAFTEVYLVFGFALVGGVVASGQAFDSIILGGPFRAGMVVLLPVVIGSVVSGVSVIGHKSLELSERTRTIAGAAGAAAATNLLLNLALVPVFGYVAAAYVTLASYLVYAAIIWTQARRAIPWNIDPAALFRYGLPAAASAAVGWFAAAPFGESEFFTRFCVGGILFLVAFIPLVYLTARGHLRVLFAVGGGATPA